MSRDFDSLLKCLDFNGRESGDVLAAAYYRQAATAIRVLSADVDHWRALHSLAQARTQQARLDAVQMEKKVRELTADLERALSPTPLTATIIGGSHG